LEELFLFYSLFAERIMRIFAAFVIGYLFR